MATAAAIPAVDYCLLATDRPRFLREVHHALAEVGFLMLLNYPKFSAEFQGSIFTEVRRFFDSPGELRDTASIALTPYYRGHTGPVQTASQLVNTFQYGLEREPVARHDDNSVPQWKRILYGPNTWPDASALPGFRPAVEALRGAYLELHHELGHLICEALGVDPARYDDLFGDDCSLAAFLSYGYSLQHIERGGVATNHRASSGPEAREKVAAELRKKISHGSHVDVTPFMTLLTMDEPGLQVLGNDNEWVEMPVVPGAVCVNVGSTLQHLSGGRMIATVHRVNTACIPNGRTRVSLPFFLLPRFTGALTPFDFDPCAPGAGTDYATADRGMMAAYNRMSLFPTCTRQFWADEFNRIKGEAKAAEAHENQVANAKVKQRAARSSL